MNRLLAFWVQLFIRWMPDAFAVAILLTLLTFALAMGVAGYSLLATVEAWGDGFWNLLTFTNQITLTLLFGYALANTPPMQRGLRAVAGWVNSPRSAYALACAATGVLALLSWGLSLVAAGIIARSIGAACREKGIRIHYPLLVASSFSGFVIWHQGITSSVGLAIATPGHFLEDQLGLIPTSQTLFTPWNLGVALCVLVLLPPFMAALRPRRASEIREMEPAETVEATPQDGEAPRTPAERIEASWIPAALIVLAGAGYLALHFGGRGLGLELNILNFAFLFAGLTLAGSAVRYANIVIEGGRVGAPFLLQYPFYAGIAGVIASSGLARMVVDFFVSVSTPATLPLFAFFSAGLLNIFIPSGGGQWAVQGPLVMTAAQELGADLPRVAMAVALGDQWTNLVQPLVLMPVLAISGLGARDIMGYTFAALALTGAIFSLALLF